MIRLQEREPTEYGVTRWEIEWDQKHTRRAESDETSCRII